MTKFDLIVLRYSTFVVKYFWCFLLLGLVICITLGLTAVLLRDLPDFNDPTKVFARLPIENNARARLSLQGFRSARKVHAHLSSIRSRTSEE